MNFREGGVLEILDERLGAFHVEVMVIVGARTLSFSEFRASEASAFYGEREPIASRRWLAGMANVFRTSVYSRRRRSDMLPAYWRSGREFLERDWL